jgi:hypothetical protein
MGDKAIAELAGTQHSLVTLRQIRDAGMSHESAKRRLAGGRWELLYDGVYRIAGTRETYEQRLLAACLAIGPEATASHRAAAIMHGMLTYKEPPVEVTTTRARSPELDGVAVHRLADLSRLWVQNVNGVPCTSPARTLVDLGAVCRVSTVEAAFDRAVGRRLVTPREVRRMMVAVARQGRRGVGTIRQLLEYRSEDIPAGVLEARMSSLLAATSLPPMIPEQVVRDVHGGFLAVADFAYPDRRIAVEVDGYEAHSGRRAVRRDKARDRALMDAKWIPLHFDWEQVDKRHPIVAREIGKWYRRRGREFGISAR